MKSYHHLLLLLLLTLTACGDGLETQEETDALGFRTVWKIDPETGLKQGKLTQYDPQGKLLSEEVYVDGELDGQRTVYWPNGRVQVQENYRMGNFEGKYITYDSLGQISSRGQYIDGTMQKAWSMWYPNGQLKEVVTFADNAENGPFREWYEDGQPKASGNYVDGDNEDGLLHLYAATGGLERVLRCSVKMCQTIWTPDSTTVAPAGPDMTLPQ